MNIEHTTTTTTTTTTTKKQQTHMRLYAAAANAIESRD